MEVFLLECWNIISCFVIPLWSKIDKFYTENYAQCFFLFRLILDNFFLLCIPASAQNQPKVFLKARRTYMVNMQGAPSKTHFQFSILFQKVQSGMANFQPLLSKKISSLHTKNLDRNYFPFLVWVTIIFEPCFLG